jgi:ribosomal protein S18 acetylase RimI-like enzyme
VVVTDDMVRQCAKSGSEWEIESEGGEQTPVPLFSTGLDGVPRSHLAPPWAAHHLDRVPAACPDHSLRLALAGDEPFLLTMLFYAAHANEGPDARPWALLANPALARYVVGFGRAGDLGVVAESADRPVGAAWVRLFADDERGYGWVDDETPELAIAVAPEFVGRGLGTRMMRELLGHARSRYRAMSLSVRKDNPARRLYVRFGFAPIGEVNNRVGGVSETMVLRFGEGEQA